jgi:Holliday junction resolvase
MERAMVHALQDRGRAAERVPLSGAAGGKFRSDISVPVMGDDWLIECKSRARDFIRLYQWLDGSDALIVRADRRKPLVVLPLDRALDLLDKAETAMAAKLARAA